MNPLHNATVTASPGPERRWFESLAHGIFEIQQCHGCAQYVFYPRSVCPHCGSGQLHWVRPSGKGKIYSTTVIRNKPEDGGDRNICLIDLAEGPRIMGCVVGVDPEAVHIGMPVSCCVAGRGDSALLVWREDDT